MPTTSILIKIILIPTLHFLVCILLLGAGLLALLQSKAIGKQSSGPGNFLVAVSLGILCNTLQFGLVLLVYRKFPVQSQIWLSIGKYALDLAFLLFVSLTCQKKFLDLLKQLLSVFSRRGNAVLLLLSLLLGLLAIMNFPHVHDSGQLMATNSMLLNGSNFLAFKRYGLGFSALLYFPNAIFQTMPMATLAAGFKLFLLFLTGLAVIYGIDRLGTGDPTASKFLYFSIIISSYFGLQGLLLLGKDSPWAVLFSVIFIFSLIGRESTAGYFEPSLLLICSMALGMIAIPYLFIFCALLIPLRLLPAAVSRNRIIFAAAIVLMLGISIRLMPIKTAIKTPEHIRPTSGSYQYRFPLNGQTSFYAYFFAFSNNGCRNSAPLVLAGMLGILLLPLSRKKFVDPALRSAALFLPVATLGCLFLAFLARGFLPTSNLDKIPFTPLSTFDAWNLVKDIPQWYVQLISGIFFILFLDALANAAVFRPRVGKNVFRGAAMIAAAIILSTNFTQIAKLKDPASFYSYGGNKNNHFARIMENIYLHPEVVQVILIAGESSQKSVTNIYWANKNYFPRKKIKTVWKSTTEEIASFFKKEPSLLIASKGFIPGLKIELKKRGNYEIRELKYFRHNKESISLISGR